MRAPVIRNARRCCLKLGCAAAMSLRSEQLDEDEAYRDETKAKLRQ